MTSAAPEGTPPRRLQLRYI